MTDTAPMVGDVVHYILDSGPGAGEHRPAMVVRLWPDGKVNLQVFPDSNGTEYNDRLPCPYWVTSRKQDEGATKSGTWHFIETEQPSAADERPILKGIN